MKSFRKTCKAFGFWLLLCKTTFSTWRLKRHSFIEYVQLSGAKISDSLAWNLLHQAVALGLNVLFFLRCSVACEQALCLGKKIARKGKGRGERACRHTFEAAIPPSCNYRAEHLSARSLSVNQFRAWVTPGKIKGKTSVFCFVSKQSEMESPGGGKTPGSGTEKRCSH